MKQCITYINSDIFDRNTIVRHHHHENRTFLESRSFELLLLVLIFFLRVPLTKRNVYENWSFVDRQMPWQWMKWSKWWWSFSFSIQYLTNKKKLLFVTSIKQKKKTTKKQKTLKPTNLIFNSVAKPAQASTIIINTIKRLSFHFNWNINKNVKHHTTPHYNTALHKKSRRHMNFSYANWFYFFYVITVIVTAVIMRRTTYAISANNYRRSNQINTHSLR